MLITSLYSFVHRLSVRQAVGFVFLLAISRGVCTTQSGCQAIHPPPHKRLTCGVRGAYGIGPAHYIDGWRWTIGSVAAASSVEECLDLCYSRSVDAEEQWLHETCKSFGFDSDQGLCRLFYPPVWATDFRPNASSSDIAYDFGCFSCPAHCPQEFNVQLVANGGFDRSPVYYGPWISRGINPAFDESPAFPSQPGHESTTAFRCELHQVPDHPGCSIYTTFSICTGAWYLATFDYSTQTLNASKNYEMGAWIGECYHNIRGAVEAPGTWRTLGCVYRQQHKTDNLFQLETGPPSSEDYTPVDILWDNAHVSRLSDSLSVLPNTPSLLSNGGFETGKNEPWDIQSKGISASIISPGLSGSKYALFWKFRHHQKAEINIAQNITTRPGTLYMFTFQYLRLQDRDQVSSPFNLIVSDANSQDSKNTIQAGSFKIDKFTNATIVNFKESSTNDVVTTEHPFYAFAAKTHIRLRLPFETKMGVGNVTFDNFSIREIAPFQNNPLLRKQTYGDK